jgi:hypothetical protein
MARKKVKPEAEFVLFDVVYEDGTRRSNRRVASAELQGPDGDEAARWIIAAEDRRLGELAGQPRPNIESVKRSPTR